MTTEPTLTIQRVQQKGRTEKRPPQYPTKAAPNDSWLSSKADEIQGFADWNDMKNIYDGPRDSWLSNKADEIQGFADRNDMKNIYDGLKKVRGPTTSGSSPLLRADGSTPVTDKEKILERWAEHFDRVLNRPSTINDEAIDRVPQVLFDETLDTVPTFEETR